MEKSDFRLNCSLIHAIVSVKAPELPTNDERDALVYALKLSRVVGLIGFDFEKTVRETITKQLRTRIQRRMPLKAKQALCEQYLYEHFGKITVPRGSSILATEKGTRSELEAIKLLSEIDGKEYLKNDELFDNGIIKGIPDIIHTEAEQKTVIDIKCPLEAATFLRLTSETLDNKHSWQLQGYMWLTGATKAQLVYCLMDTPKSIISSAKRGILASASLNGEISDRTYARADALDAQLTYNDIPKPYRLFRHHVEADASMMAKIKEAAGYAIEYLHSLQEQMPIPPK